MIRPEYYKYLNDVYNSGVIDIGMAHYSLSEKFKIDIGVSVEVVDKFLRLKSEQQDDSRALACIGKLSESLARNEVLALKLIKALALNDQREIRGALVSAFNFGLEVKQ